MFMSLLYLKLGVCLGVNSESSNRQASLSPLLSSLFLQSSPPSSTSAAVVGVERGVMRGGVVVDEDMVHEVVSLSQRRSAEAVGMCVCLCVQVHMCGHVYRSGVFVYCN